MSKLAVDTASACMHTRNVTSFRRDHGRFLWTENDPQGSRVTIANGRGHRGNHDRGSGYKVTRGHEAHMRP